MKAIAKQRTTNGLVAGWLAIMWMAILLSATTAARADIYFWEDDKGVIHFSNQESPPNASLYMREPAARNLPEPEAQSTARETSAMEVARQQAETQARLDEANRKLDRALERVDELTESVSRSRAQAAEAAEAARLAELDAEAARNYQSEVKERIIVHSVPYRKHYPYRNKFKGHRPYKHQVYGKGKGHSRNLKHDKKFVPYFNNGKKSKLYKHYRHQDHTRHYSAPSPILPPGRSHIPRAYGIR